MSQIGVIALARPTFDVPFAEEVAQGAFGVIAEVAPGFVGSTDLLFDAPVPPPPSTRCAAPSWTP